MVDNQADLDLDNLGDHKHYSLAETAKANNLKPYDYFKYLLTEIPKHLDDKNDDFCESLLPWSENLPADCRKKQ